MRKGILMVISGPAGVGKGTLAGMLLERDASFSFSVSATTRNQRPGEVEGTHYWYMTEEAFSVMENNGDFLETATVHGYRYGTPLKPVMNMLEQGLDILLDVDSQGAKAVMSKLADCVTVFILPPSFVELERRLRARNTEAEEEICRRLFNARNELEQLNRYRYAIINDDVNTAYEQLTAIVTAERLNTVRYFPKIT